MNCNKLILPKKGRLILSIFLAAFSIRLLYIFQVLRFPLTEYLVKSNTFDQYGFDQNALKIASCYWMDNEVFGKEPLYSYFLAAIYRVFGHNHYAVYIIQALLASIGAVLLYKISKDIFNRKTGTIAAFIFSFYSISIYHDAIILRESLIAFFNILLLYLILKALKSNKTLMWIVSGAALGLLTLLRHNILLPFILAFILCGARPLKKAFRYALIFCLGVFIALLPVLIRNYLVSGYSYVGISKEVNAFWVGNNPVSSGVDVEWSNEYHLLNNKSQGNIIKTMAVFVEEVKNKPKVYTRLYLRKIWMFFNAYEAPSNDNYYLYREEFPTILRWPLFDFRFVCSFGLIGVFLAFLGRRKPYLLFMFFAVLASSVVLFHIQSRFRLNVVPFFIIFCAYSICHIFDKIRDKAFLKCAVILLTAISLYIIIKPDLTYAGFKDIKDKIRAIDRTNLALSYVDIYKRQKDKNLLNMALRECNLALKEETNSSVPHLIKGQIYFLENRFADSLNEYKRAVIYDNRSPFLYNEIAGVYYTWNDYKKSFLHIKRALRLSPGNKVFEKNLSMIPL